LASVLVHLLIIALVLYAPEESHEALVIERPQGAGGPGPAGGGGGGRRGTGGVTERIQFVKVSPQPAQPVAVPPPVVVPTPKPIVPPPEPVKPQEPVPEAKPEIKEIKVDAPPVAMIASVVPGVGGGSGRDGTIGSGPGSGGGVGTGIGTGRGSGVGPGTGGGTQENYPPTPTELFIPPLPMPDKVRGFHLVAEYDIDETGKIVDFNFTPTRDGDYNKRLREVLRSFRFRPGSRPDGTPIRMKAQIIYDF
jgi:protein TonB